MSELPYKHLSLDDQRKLKDDSQAGTKPIFEGEEASPVFKDARHALLGTTYFDVSPEQLIDVAKHIAINETNHRDAVQRAYSIICEAHVVSRNIGHWNEKVRNNHTSKLIHELVENAELNKREQPLRKRLLSAFYEALESPKNEDDASKEFNRWMRSKARLADYKSTIPYNPHHENYDHDLYVKLNSDGWILWHNMGSNGFLIVPEATQPKHDPPRKKEKRDHITQTYWGTTDVWWPEATGDMVDVEKDKYLNKGRTAFLSKYCAEKALEKFQKWLELDASIKGEDSEKRSIPRSKEGQFVSDKDKGAKRNDEGKYS